MSFKTFVKADIKQPQYEHNPDHFSFLRYMEDDLYRKYFDETDFSHYYSSFNTKPSRFEYNTKVARSRGKQIKHRDELLEKFYSAEPSIAERRAAAKKRKAAARKRKAAARKHEAAITTINTTAAALQATNKAEISKINKESIKSVYNGIFKDVKTEVRPGKVFLEKNLKNELLAVLLKLKEIDKVKTCLNFMVGPQGVIIFERYTQIKAARMLMVQQYVEKILKKPGVLKRIKNANNDTVKTSTFSNSLKEKVAQFKHTISLEKTSLSNKSEREIIKEIIEEMKKNNNFDTNMDQNEWSDGKENWSTLFQRRLEALKKKEKGSLKSKFKIAAKSKMTKNNKFFALAAHHKAHHKALHGATSLKNPKNHGFLNAEPKKETCHFCITSSMFANTHGFLGWVARILFFPFTMAADIFWGFIYLAGKLSWRALDALFSLLGAVAEGLVSLLDK